MRMSLKQKISFPLILLAAIAFFFSAFLYYSLNIKVADLLADTKRAEEMDMESREIFRAIQSGILTRDQKYPIEAAASSLNMLDQLHGLSANYPVEARKLQSMHENYYATTVSITSLFMENRLQEAGQRLKEAEAAFGKMNQALEDFRKILADKQAGAFIHIHLFTIVFMVLFVLVFCIQWFSLSMALAPIRYFRKKMRDISRGDLTLRLSVKSRDEIGDMALSVNAMVEDLQNTIRQIALNAETLASSAAQLSATSTQTAQNIEDVSEKTMGVAAASEEFSANTASVAISMDETTANLSSVASATEEMSATIGEVAANTEKTRVISAEAGEQALSISSLMKELGAAAKAIGNVTETITEISEQTNLLALNATIEAARAGEAGKGFAVVANEIKELAKQTAAATEDIRHKISGVQSTTGSATTGIERITSVITETSHLVSGIAAAIEEQAAVTREVAENVAQASRGVEYANGLVKETADVAGTIAQDMAWIDKATGEIRSSGDQVKASAGDLSSLSRDLKDLVGQFRV